MHLLSPGLYFCDVEAEDGWKVETAPADLRKAMIAAPSHADIQTYTVSLGHSIKVKDRCLKVNSNYFF